MNIIVAVHDSVSPIRGGGGLRTIKTATELKRRGHNVFIIAPSDSDKISGIRCIKLPFVEKGKTGFVGLACFVIRYVYYFLRVYFKEKINAVFVHNAVLGFPTAVLKLFLKFRFVLDITDLHTEYMRYEDNKSFARSLALPFMRQAEYYSARRADKVIAVTNAMKEMLISQGSVPASKIEVVPDGVDFEKFNRIAEHKIKNPPPVGNIIYIGSMEETDGVMIFVEAIPIISAARPDAKFIFIGGGGDFDAVVERIKKAGLYEKCVFSGWVNYEKVIDYLSIASVGLITRPPSPPNHTVITLKLLEYWAAGIAVVSTRLKGIEEAASMMNDSDGEAIVFYEYDNAGDLANKILHIISSPEILRQIVSNGIKKSRWFEWRLLINQIADKVERVL